MTRTYHFQVRTGSECEAGNNPCPLGEESPHLVPRLLCLIPMAPFAAAERGQEEAKCWEAETGLWGLEKTYFTLKPEEVTQVSQWIINSNVPSNKNSWKTTSVIHSYCPILSLKTSHHVSSTERLWGFCLNLCSPNCSSRPQNKPVTYISASHRSLVNLPMVEFKFSRNHSNCVKLLSST